MPVVSKKTKHELRLELITKDKPREGKSEAGHDYHRF